jgi:hypothetical protein
MLANWRAVRRTGHITMHVDQCKKAEQLLAALGRLGRAQELEADDELLTDLAARVQDAAHEFRAVSQ